MGTIDIDNAVSLVDRFTLWEFLHDHWFGKALTNSSELREQLKLWFFRDSEKDQELKRKFEQWLLPAASGEFRSWHGSPRSALSLVILLDQVPLNIFRGTPRAFHFDEASLFLSQKFVKNGFDRQLHPLERVFLYLPFQHSEKIENQKISMEKFTELDASASRELKEFFGICKVQAELHFKAIQRFGRFPHRNEILGRQSTPEEVIFLRDPRHHF